MRKIIDIVVENSHTPPKREEHDDPHYAALERTGFFGEQGAGCIFIAKSTGRFMLVHRSHEVLEPFTWGNCGGACGAHEDPAEAAKREGYEETGYSGHISLVPLNVFTKGSFRYSNFLAVIEDEFEPSLGWEATDHKWCTLDDLPSPLHFGIQFILNDPDCNFKIEEIGHNSM